MGIKNRSTLLKQNRLRNLINKPTLGYVTLIPASRNGLRTLMWRLRTQLCRNISWLTMGLLVVVGFWFRWKGIVDNHSFWADEAYVAGLAKDVVSRQLSLGQALSGLAYQKLHVLSAIAALRMWGINEMAARLPSVLWGVVGVGFAYLVAKKLSNWGGGVLAGGVYALSYLNLVYATQAKPYAALETLFLVMVYLGLNKKTRYRWGWLLGVTGMSVGLHALGVISLVFIVMQYWWYQAKNKKVNNEAFRLRALVLVVGVSVLMLAWPSVWSVIAKVGWYNNTTYLRELLWRQYGWMVLPAMYGMALSYRRNKATILGVVAWMGVLLVLWNFKSYSHNVRYLLPLFGVIMVFFGVFWAKVGERFFDDKWGVSALAVMVVVWLGGGKIARTPLPYYNPNLDLYGDVQNADYKTMYSLIKTRFPDYKEMAIFNDLPDTERWYMERLSDAYFNTTTGKPRVFKYGKWNVPVWVTKEKLVEEMKKHKKGIVIVEDWQSFMPEEVKEYVKQNLKFEFEVSSLTQVGGSWPLKVYSWGYEK